MDLSPLSAIRYGSYVSNGSSQLLNFGFIPSYFLAWDISAAASTAASVLKKVEWFSKMAAASALTLSSNAGANGYDVSTLISSGGITGYNGTLMQSFSPVAVTSVSQAAAALVTTSAAHGFSVGDSVRLYGVVGASSSTAPAMAGLNSLVFTVQTVPSTTTFTINVNTSGFASAGSGGYAIKVFPLTYWQPKRSTIVAISQASPAVVTTAENHLLQTGDIVRLYVPAQFGMSQLNLVQAEVSVLSPTTFALYQPNTTQIPGGQVPISSSSFSAFSFPVNLNPPYTYAQVVPVGEDSFQVSDPKTNTAFIGLQLGSNVVGSSGDVWQYLAIFGS